MERSKALIAIYGCEVVPDPFSDAIDDCNKNYVQKKI